MLARNKVPSVYESVRRDQLSTLKSEPRKPFMPSLSKELVEYLLDAIRPLELEQYGDWTEVQIHRHLGKRDLVLLIKSQFDLQQGTY